MEYWSPGSIFSGEIGPGDQFSSDKYVNFKSLKQNKKFGLSSVVMINLLFLTSV